MASQRFRVFHTRPKLARRTTRGKIQGLYFGDGEQAGLSAFPFRFHDRAPALQRGAAATELFWLGWHAHSLNDDQACVGRHRCRFAAQCVWAEDGSQPL